jgi:hypothetical protein
MAELIEDVSSYPMKLSKNKKLVGPERSRTADLLLAKQALYQLSYRPIYESQLTFSP